jgi:hypothetical protein
MSFRLDPVLAFRVLGAHNVRFVLIGGLAGNVWGSPAITQDLDICYERSAANCDALAKALAELHATLRGAPDGLPFLLDGRTIRMGDSFTFNTDAGDFDCLGTPAGTSGYADLLKSASEFELEDGLRVMVASIDDLLRMKRAADRPKDRIAVEILTAVKEERERS